MNLQRFYGVILFGVLAATGLPAAESRPGGVTIDGAAEGLEPLKSIEYQRRGNKFVINGSAQYVLPIGARQFREVLQAVRENDLFGVSLTPKRDIITYGALKSNGRVAADLVKTDYFLFGVTTGEREYMGNARLPHGYDPLPAKKRKEIPVAAYYKFNGFKFAKNEAGEYKLVDCILDITLFPLSKEKAADGGNLVDEAAMQNGFYADEERKNVAHINTYKDEYLQLAPVAKAVDYGAAVVFARYLRDSGLDLDQALPMFK